MIASDSFRADERISETDLFAIDRGRDAEGRSVLIKRARTQADPKLAQARLRREWEIGKGLEHPRVSRYRGLFMSEGRIALLMEDDDLRLLEETVTEGGIPLDRFYSLARPLTQAIAYLHAQGIIHKDLSPANIFVGEGGLRLSGLGVATRLSRESASGRNPQHLEGSLAYMSPEQTGRMNRAYDHRSDLYSLGAIFYELLTGRRPVEGSDALSVIHAHIARAPIPPISLRSDLRARLSALVMRLLAKDAGDRYQSAVGVLADLERLASHHEAQGDEARETGPNASQSVVESGDVLEADWILGSEDVPRGMPISETIYGREAELRALHEAFERSREGSPQLMLVSGYSGIGKTALVGEIERPLIEAQGFFSSGKFDQFERSQPYSAFAQAFRGLMRQILAGSDASLAEWRHRIQAAVGNRGQLICEIVPELAWVIGDQPEISELGPAEAEARFVNVMQSFLSALVSPDQPLTLFLDDLQWADLASLRLLRRSLLDGDLGGLLLIGAYRDNEVEAGHPLLLALAEIRAAGCAVGAIELGPLTPESSARLVEDTLHSDAEHSAPLASLLHTRSEGNPFFLKALLTQLYERGLLAFDLATHRWEWDLQAIERLEVADDVVSFVLDRLQGLPRTTRAVLPIAANFGARFDLEGLSLAAEARPADVQQALWPALEQGLVLPVGNAYKYRVDGPELSELDASGSKASPADEGATEREHPYERPAEVSLDRVTYAFAHDRVQQAAAALVTEGERAEIRGAIGRNLLATASEAERRERALEIADHLNAAPAPTDPADRLALAQLNLEAASKAKQAIAFEPAMAYLETGIALLGDEGWSQEYETMHALRTEAAETAYLMGDDAGVDTHSHEVLEHARSVLDGIPGHAIRALHHSAQHRNAESLAVTREALSALGVDLPDKPNNLSILKGLLGTKRRIEKHSIEDLLAQPAMKNPEKLEAMRLLMEASQPAFYSEPELFPHLAYELVRLSLLHGNSPHSAWGYAIYALVLYSAFGSTETATRYLDFSEELHDRMGAAELNCKMQVVLYHGFRHATFAIGASADKLREALDLGIEVGDSDYGSLAAELVGQYRFYQGADLVPAEREMERMGQAIVKLKQERNLHNLNQYRQLARNLIGDGPDPLRLLGAIYDDAEELPRLQEANDASYQFHFYYVRGYQRYLLGHPEAALEDLEQSKTFEKAVPAQGVMFQQYFLHALVLLSLLPTGGQGDKPNRSRLKQAKRLAKKVGKWAVHGPMNYENKHLLLSAELARVKGDALEAADLFERAIASSIEYGFQHEVAIALERSARFHAQQGRKAVAGRYEKLAVEAYDRWGAKAVVARMTAKQPWLRPSRPSASSGDQPRDRSERASSMSEQLDLRTVIKAGQALSGEIRVANYLERLMDVVVENAGAERGYLIAEEDGRLVVEARALPEVSHDAEAVKPDPPKIARSVDLEGPVDEETLPTGILGFVARTGETVVANDPAESGAFVNDPYVRSARPRSVLCLPLVNRGRRVGLLYLENRLVADAFTPDRVELLELLSTQAAISVENGRLYSRLENYSQSLEEKVAERTGELAEKNVELERVLEDLRASQRQLVHTAKMASLGELTAGIAHEIKNPLNFINNFAEVSVELLGELGEEIQRVQDSLPGDARAEIEDLTGMVGQNLERIAGHGKRADGIIAGMLFHSRSGSGDLQATDLNDLVELALNLAYHGLRAQNASFNARLSTDFDERIGEIEILPQDLSRALLNIFNNGLQSVHARSRESDADYRPELRVETRDRGDEVEIHIHDNGLGLSTELKDRIFQPFFTTKDAGEGTGLGLSLTYEIVTEGHGGEIQVDGREGEFASFRIRLPKERQEGGNA